MQPKPGDSTPSNCHTLLMGKFPRLDSRQLVPWLGIDTECQLPSPSHPPKEPPASPGNEPGSRRPEVGSSFKQRQLQEPQRRSWGRGTVGDSEDQPKFTSGRTVSGSIGLSRGSGDHLGRLIGALGSETSVTASITTDIGSNIQNCSSACGDLDSSSGSVRKSLSFKDRQRYGPPNPLSSRVEPIQPDIRMFPATQSTSPRTTLPRKLMTGSTNALGKENTTSVIGGGGAISEGRSSGASLVNLCLSAASLMDHVNTGSLTPPQYSPNSSMVCDYRKSSEWKPLAKDLAQTHSSPSFCSSALWASLRQQEPHYVHGLPPLQHHRSHHHNHYQRPLQQRTEGCTFTPSPPVSSRHSRPPGFLSSMHSGTADSLSSNDAPQSQQSHGTLFEPVRGDPPLALAETNTGFAFTFADTSGEDCVEESTMMPSQRCEADRTLPPQPMQSTLPMVSETVLTRTDTSESPSTWGSFAPMGRDREKIFRRNPSQPTVANGIKSPRPVEEGSFSCEVIDGFMQRVHGSDLSPGTPPWLMPYPTCESSNSRICGDPTLPAAATRGNRRRSSFSSLYFSMTKRCRELHRAKVSYQPSQNIVDDDTVLENRGDSRRDELLDKDSDEDSFTADELQTIGMQETEEHVFIPRYEILEDGQTPMEIMISSIRVSNESRASLSGNPSTTDIAAAATAAATAAANAAKSKRMDTRGNPLDITGGDRRRWSKNPSVDTQDDVFTFGVVSAAYATDPEEESDDVDCKVAARLLFNAEHGVAVLNACDEVSKYISKTVVPNANEAGDDAGDHCKCSMEFIIKDMRGFDYSRYNAHELYHHCVYCARRPAAFLCLHCLQATCPSHVTRHYKDNEGVCTLFLNQLDITTSYDRVFWCEKCESFTWRHTEAYDPLVDQLAVTRGSYLHEAVRDVSCVGYNVQLKRPVRFGASSLIASPQRDRCYMSGVASPMAPSALPAPVMASSLHTPLDPPAFVPNTPTERDVSRRFTVPSLCASPLVTQLFLQRDVKSLRGPNALRVGEAVPRLVALGAKVQGWRTTQEDAEAAFVVNIPSLTAQPQPNSAESRGKIGGDNAKEHGGDKAHAAGEQEEAEETIPMAVFCVFDGHGGDAVAKLAARLFESHLRKAIAASPYENDARARALLFHLDIESTSPVYSLGESSPVHSRINTAQNHNQGRVFISNPCRGPSMLEMYVDEEDVQEIVFTEEALRRHVESTTMYPIASEPIPAVAPTRLWAASVSEGSAQHLNDRTAASPLVSPQEMEMLRVYFASIMEDALLSLDDALRLSPEGRRGDYQCVGCTACIVGITTNFILCANVGDSGAAYYTPHTIQRISATHRITDPVEEQRIRAAGYALHGNRIEGLLAVPRALGDYDFKQCGGKGPREQAVIAVPDVTIMPVPSLLETERWGVLVACDGVWDSATLRQVHHAIVNTRNDLDVAASASEAVVQAGEMVAEMRHSSAAEIVEVDPLLLTSAAGIFAQCVAPEDNNEGIGMDNCSVMLIERR